MFFINLVYMSSCMRWSEPFELASRGCRSFSCAKLAFLGIANYNTSIKFLQISRGNYNLLLFAFTYWLSASSCKMY